MIKKENKNNKIGINRNVFENATRFSFKDTLKLGLVSFLEKITTLYKITPYNGTAQNQQCYTHTSSRLFGLNANIWHKSNAIIVLELVDVPMYVHEFRDLHVHTSCIGNQSIGVGQ